MPAFQRTTVRTPLRGVNLNRPIDLLREGELWFGYNIRTYQDGRIEQRPGTTLVSSNFADHGDNTQWINFLYDLNDSGVGNAGNYTYAGYSYTGETVGELWWGRRSDFSAFPITYQSIDTGFSGKPLTGVSMDPVGAPDPWLYIGDSTKNRKYSNRYVSAGTPIPVPIGVPATWVKPSVTASGTGLTGSYTYRYRLRDPKTGSKGNAGPAAGWSISGDPSAPAGWPNFQGYITLANQGAQMVIPNLATLAPGWPSAEALVVDIFRFGGANFFWSLVGTANPGDTFTDAMTDIQAQTAEALVFTQYQPFVTPDIERSGALQTAAASAGITGSGSVLTQQSGDTFNSAWLPGTTINIENVKPCTLKRWISTTQIEVNEDVGAIGVNTNFTITGALKSGQPLPILFGPWGTGATGKVMFGLGDASSPGTLYWCNGNDPDAVTLANSLDLTDPSDGLQNGCIYDGRIYVWSGERMFLVSPSGTLTGALTFTAQVIPGARGLWARYALAVGDKIWWEGKDGIYESAGGVWTCITDDQLYPVFPHDDQAALTIQRTVTYLYPPDQTKLDTHGLCFADGMLLFTYPMTTPNTTAILVRDMKNGHGGWFIDIYTPPHGAYVKAYYETGIHSLLLAFGNQLTQFSGTTDLGVTVPWFIEFGCWDGGDPRLLKFFGDMIAQLEGTALSAKWTVLGDLNATTLATGTVTTTSGRLPYTFDITGGALAKTIALRLERNVNNLTAMPTVYLWQPSYVPKPEASLGRPTDKTDDGYNGAKYLRGWCVESNTFNVQRKYNVLADGVAVSGGPYSITANGQIEIPFALATPLVATELQLQPDASDTSTVGWEIFQVRWIWDKYPDLTILATPIMNMGYARAKFLQGVAVPIDTGGLPVQFVFKSDGNVTAYTSANVTTTGKTTVVFTWDPFVTHLIQVFPQGAARCWWEEASWIWEPTPEQALTWKTPFFTHGMSGWIHQRLAWFAYLSDGQVTLKRTFVGGQSDSYTLAASTSYTKVLVPLGPLKGTAVQYSAIGAGPLGVKVFANDCEFHTKEWGSPGPYSPQKPIGGQSVVRGAEV